MKILSIATIVAAAAFCFSSCSKQYNTTTSNSQNGSNGNGGGNGGNGGGSGSFNWTGTAPLSLKLNDTSFVPTYVNFSEGAGYTGVSFGTVEWNFSVIVPTSTAAGTVLSTPTPGVFTGGNAIAGGVVLASWGKIKVITNDANTFEGYFYGDLKDATGLSSTVVYAREGYFKVAKE